MLRTARLTPQRCLTSAATAARLYNAYGKP
jgi:hypothetical protein